MGLSWRAVAIGATGCAAAFAALLGLTWVLSTAVEVATESGVAGVVVAAFFVFFASGVARLLHLGGLGEGLAVMFLAVACLVASFLPPISSDGASLRGPRAEYVAYAVLTGGLYMVVIGIVFLSAARRNRRQGR